MSTRAIARLRLAASTLIPVTLLAATTQPVAAHTADQQERFLYVTTIAQSASDPDFVAVVGADPEQPDFGEIVNRIRP